MWRTLSLALAAALGGCTTDVPCSTCPSVEGSWELTFEEAVLAGCEGTPPPAPPTALELSRIGSSLKGRLGATELVGTAYDSFDFSLSAGGPTDAGIEHLSLRARFVGGPSDGGARLASGKYDATHRRTDGGGSRTCTEQRAFSGVRR